MNATWVPIGEVQISTGWVSVHVDPSTGMVIQSFFTRDRRSSDYGMFGRSSALELAALLNRAVVVAPTIKAAYEVRRRCLATSSDTYDRIVNQAIGGAR